MDNHKQEMQNISIIVSRYLDLLTENNEVVVINNNVRINAVMDIHRAHEITPIDLSALATASDVDLIHDVSGIMKHIDRDTGELVDCFVPRYVRPQIDSPAVSLDSLKEESDGRGSR